MRQVPATLRRWILNGQLGTHVARSIFLLGLLYVYTALVRIITQFTVHRTTALWLALKATAYRVPGLGQCLVTR